MALSVGRPPIVVATKVDKLKMSERVGALRRLQEGLGLVEATQLFLTRR